MSSICWLVFKMQMHTHPTCKAIRSAQNSRIIPNVFLGPRQGFLELRCGTEARFAFAYEGYTYDTHEPASMHQPVTA